MAFTWESFADSGKDQYVGWTYPPAIRLSADKFVAFSRNSNFESKVVDYSTSTNELSKSILETSAPPWDSPYNVNGFSICTLSDGRVLAAGGFGIFDDVPVTSGHANTIRRKAWRTPPADCCAGWAAGRITCRATVD